MPILLEYKMTETYPHRVIKAFQKYVPDYVWYILQFILKNYLDPLRTHTSSKLKYGTKIVSTRNPNPVQHFE